MWCKVRRTGQREREMPRGSEGQGIMELSSFLQLLACVRQTHTSSLGDEVGHAPAECVR
jgi:hypothetical protein